VKKEVFPRNVGTYRNVESVPLLSRPLSGDNQNDALEQLETLCVTLPCHDRRQLSHMPLHCNRLNAPECYIYRKVCMHLVSSVEQKQSM
jgi:hypothetical protein